LSAVVEAPFSLVVFSLHLKGLDIDTSIGSSDRSPLGIPAVAVRAFKTSQDHFSLFGIKLIFHQCKFDTKMLSPQFIMQSSIWGICSSPRCETFSKAPAISRLANHIKRPYVDYILTPLRAA